MRRAPPHLGGQAVAKLAECLDGAGEQQRLAQRDDLGLEALLPRLGEETESWEGNSRAEVEKANCLAAYSEEEVEESRPGLGEFQTRKVQ